MKCHACGQENADSALFCTACRRPLVAPTKLPTRLEPRLEPAFESAAPSAPTPPAPRDVGGRNRYAPPDADAPTIRTRAADDSQIITDEEVRSAFIGDSNTLYYLGAFDRIQRGEGGGWNWPAFLVTWYWLLYRKMWLPATIYFFAVPIVNFFVLAVIGASPGFGAVLGLCWFAACWIGPPLLANGWYYRHCLNKVREVRARSGSKDQILARLEAAGGTSSIAVIIVAVLAVMVLPGILAAVSIPAYQTYTVKAKVSDAIVEGSAVAQALGRQYEATGQFPTDIDRIVQQLPKPSQYVTGIEQDGLSGTLTVHIAATPSSITGSIQLAPSVDSNRHVTWSCSTTDLIKYVPKNCRG
jgi:Tfp pilus assembly protein PilE